jgi:predicted nucleic acid-binding protein
VIVVDTNVLIALADRRDAHHAQCRDWLAGCDETLIVSPTVLAEACYMIDKYLGAESEAKFLDSVGIGPSYRFQLAELLDADVRRMAALVRRYADRHMGGTDASVVALCERLSITTVATVNRRDFANVQARHVTALTIVP